MSREEREGRNSAIGKSGLKILLEQRTRKFSFAIFAPFARHHSSGSPPSLFAIFASCAKHPFCIASFAFFARHTVPPSRETNPFRSRLASTDELANLRSMLATLVMTLIGRDRPGLVEMVAARVAEHGGNWLESRMCRLGGQFAGIVRVEVPQERAEELARILKTLQSQGLAVTTQTETGITAQVAVGTTAVLQLVGQDRPGILHQISRVLAAHAVNVEELSSERVSAPIDGNMLFQARATVLLPPSASMATIRTDLEKIAADLMVDVELTPPGGGE